MNTKEMYKKKINNGKQRYLKLNGQNVGSYTIHLVSIYLQLQTQWNLIPPGAINK